MPPDVCCPSCARAVVPVMTQPPRAWLAGLGGCVAVLAVLLLGLFAVVLLTTLRQVPAGEAEGFAYDLTASLLRDGGLLPAVLLPIVIGSAVVRARRRPVCPLCRSPLPGSRSLRD